MKRYRKRKSPRPLRIFSHIYHGTTTTTTPSVWFLFCSWNHRLLQFIIYRQNRPYFCLFSQSDYYILLWRRRKKKRTPKRKTALFVFWWRFDRRIIYYVENKMHHLIQKNKPFLMSFYLPFFAMVLEWLAIGVRRSLYYYYRKTTTTNKKIRKKMMHRVFRKATGQHLKKKKFLLHILQLLY